MRKHDECQKFSDRLREALRNIGLPDDSPTRLQRNFNLRSDSEVTVHAARKWLVGEAIPTQDKLLSLAAWLGVAPNWLRFGVGESTQSVSDAALAPRTLRMLEGFERLVDRDQKLVQAMIDNMLHGAAA